MVPTSAIVSGFVPMAMIIGVIDSPLIIEARLVSLLTKQDMLKAGQ